MKKETYPFMNMSYKKCPFSKDDEMEPPPLHSSTELINNKRFQKVKKLKAS